MRKLKRISLIATALALVITACGAVGDAAETTTTTLTDAEPVAAPSAESPTTDSCDSGATEISNEAQPLEPGVYVNSTTGVPITFCVEEGWLVKEVGPRLLALGRLGAGNSEDRAVVFMRPVGLADPMVPTVQSYDWPADDIDGWLKNLSEGILAAPAQASTLGGAEGVTFDVRLEDTYDCKGPDSVLCAGFTADELSMVWFEKGKDYRIHWLDVPGGEPLVVYVSSGDSGPEWINEADEVLSTIALGTSEQVEACDAPLWEQGYPTEVPAGEVRLPLGGGVSFMLDEDRPINQEDNGALAEIELRVPAAVRMMLPHYDSEGEPIGDTDEIVDILEAAGVMIDELAATTVADSPTRVLDVSDGPSETIDAVLRWEPGSYGWAPPSAGRIWLLDTDRGIIMITAESLLDETSLPDALALAEPIVESLQLVESPC